MTDKLDMVTPEVSLTQGPATTPSSIPALRIAKLADAYYISIAPSVMTNTAPEVKQLAVWLEGLREDETLIVSFDPDNYGASSWSNYITFMGALDSCKAKVIIRCDKMDFTEFAYFYFLGDQLDMFHTGGLFFRPLYSNHKAALSDQEKVGVSYLLTLLKRGVERGLLSEDQYNQLDAGGYTHLDYDLLLGRKRNGSAECVILRE